MNNAGWFLLVGGLMLAMGLTVPVIKRLPVTSAIVYLAVGLLVGPTGFGLFHFNPLKQSALLEVVTEVVVLISLFSAGVKMPVPLTFRRWRRPIFLAFFSMAITVALVAGFTHYFLGLSLGAAVLLGAIIAPTDPVLATRGADTPCSGPRSSSVYPDQRGGDERRQCLSFCHVGFGPARTT